MELFEIIRKEHFIQQKSIRQIAAELKIHRRQVRQAITNAVPPESKKAGRKISKLTIQFKEIINNIITNDLTAPKKQRHTGERIYQRLLEEHNYIGSSVTVRQYVYSQRKTLGLSNKAFIPLFHEAGIEAEVGWYEVYVDFPNGRTKIYIFQMRACFSGKEFHMAFSRQNQISFIEGHIAAFNYFKGVFKKIRYDNLTLAVKKVLRGRKRIETERFISLRSHYLFESVFCLPGINGAHEKGGVECGVGRFRRSHLVPVPKVANLIHLNEYLLKSCSKDDARIIIGKKQSIQENWDIEKLALMSFPGEFNAAEICSPIINKKSLAAVKDNFYSVPVIYVGQTIEAQVFAEKIYFLKKGACIATHLRCHLKKQLILELEHYLPLLRRKPGALTNSLALKQAKQNGKWPKIYDQYWQALNKQYGNESNKHMVALLWWARDFGPEQVEQVLAKALDYGCIQIEHLIMLMRHHLNPTINISPLSYQDLGKLAIYQRGNSNVQQYNQLLIFQE